MDAAPEYIGTYSLRVVKVSLVCWHRKFRAYFRGLIKLNGSNWHVLNVLNHWLSEGLSPWLATVIETYGSSPRPVGSMMMYHPEKGIVGSLSGGCIEQELTNQLADQPGENRFSYPQVIRYGESAEQQARLALPCGGHLNVLLEKITPQEHSIFQKLESALHGRQTINRHINLNDQTLFLTEDSTDHDIQRTEHEIIHSLRPHDKLLLVGAGEVARCVAEIAKNLEFEVTLCDFRDEFLQGWQVADVDVQRCMPDDLIAQAFNDQHCAIVALAHDPRVDDMAMMEALKGPAFYVGAMGSEKTSQNRRQRLLTLDVNAQQLERLHAPIGLDIGSKTPYEIAISIISHLISERSKAYHS